MVGPLASQADCWNSTDLYRQGGNLNTEGQEVTSRAIKDCVPRSLSTFPKLQKGEPYQFERWDQGKHGFCLRYSFIARDRATRIRKYVVLAEIVKAAEHLTNTGAFSRTDYQSLCVLSQSSGPCGFAVTGRILEALGLGRYVGRKGFMVQSA